MSDFFDMLDRAKETWKKSYAQRKERRAREAQQIRLEDLTRKFHVLDEEVRLPIPNLFALKWMDEYFGGIDNIDLGNLGKLGAVIWILENQGSVDEIDQMTKEQINNAINRGLSEIPAVLHPRYMMCIDDIFRVIKKNWIQRQKSLLNDLLEQLGNQTSGAGGPSVSLN